MAESLSDGDEHQERLARYLAGESTPEEREAVRRWAASDPRHQRELDTLQAQLDRLAFPSHADIDVDAAWNRISRRLDGNDVRPFVRPHFRPALAAAAVIALIGLGGLALWRSRQVQPVARELTTGIGRRDSIRFDDGSRIVMAPGSRLTLAQADGGRPREVELDGEAWFDIRHDNSRPFAVRVGSLVITDLGTAFSVRGIPAGGLDVRVMEGVVSLRPSAEDSAVVLRQGDRGTWRAGEGFQIFHGSMARPPAWLEGRLEFEDASLSEVSQDLRRWYGLELRLADSALARRHLTATFAGESRARVAGIIALTLGATLELRGDTAILRPRPDLPSTR